MNKGIALAAGLCAVLALSGCKSNESAYKKAYEKAKAQQEAQQAVTETETVVETPVVTPLVESTETQTIAAEPVEDVAVRTEPLTVVDGSGLKTYSVIVGAYAKKFNADAEQQRLKAAGYDAQIAYNEERGLYRVVASTFDDKASAVASRDQLRSKYADAWLLYNK